MTRIDAQAGYRWHAHPAREHRGRAAAGAAIIVAVAGGVLITVWIEAGRGPALAWAAVSLLILVLSMHRFFFPSRFVIDDEGITVASWLGRRSRRWADLRRFTCDADGGYLSTRARRSRLDAYQGMHVLFGTQRDEVVRTIRSHLGPEAAVTPAGGPS